MKLYLGLALTGLPTGALYALQAMGIVLVYRTTKVFSFAQAGFGVLAAFAAAALADHGVPALVAGLIGVLIAAGASVLMELTSIAFTKGAIQKTVVTLGWLLALQGLAALLFGTTGTAAPVFATKHDLLDVNSLGFALTWLDVSKYLITAGIGIGLTVFLTRTSLGTAMRGVSDDPEAARLLGLPGRLVARLSWALGGALAGLSGVLAAPTQGLDQTQLLVFTVAAIAVALAARLSSLPLCLAAGFGLGAGQQVVQKAVNDITGESIAGIAQLTAFVVVLASLTLRKRTGRADTGGGGLAPSRVRPLPTGPRALGIAAAVVGVIFVVPAVFGPTGDDNLVGIAVWSMATLSLVVLAGIVGQVSICTGAFMGVGGFAAAIANGDGVPFYLSLAVGAVAAAVAATLVALPAIRLEPLELAIATISLSFAADNFLFAYTPVVGKSSKRTIEVPHFFSSLPQPQGSGQAGDLHLAWLCFGFFALAGLAAANLRRGRGGAALSALRSSRAATAAMGFSVVSVKLRGFAVSGLIAGVAGGLLITHLNTLEGIGGGTGVYDTTASITLLAYAVIGGLGNIPAALIGGILVQLPTILAGSSSPTPDGTARTTLLSGVVLVLVVVLAPDGLVDAVARLVRRLRRPGPPPQPHAELPERELVGTR